MPSLTLSMFLTYLSFIIEGRSVKISCDNRLSPPMEACNLGPLLLMIFSCISSKIPFGWFVFTVWLISEITRRDLSAGVPIIRVMGMEFKRLIGLSSLKV